MKIVLVQPKVPWNSSWECISLGGIKAYAEQFDYKTQRHEIVWSVA